MLEREYAPAHSLYLLNGVECRLSKESGNEMINEVIFKWLQLIVSDMRQKLSCEMIQMLDSKYATVIKPL